MNIADMKKAIADIEANIGNLDCEELKELFNAVDRLRDAIKGEADDQECDWIKAPMPIAF